MPITDEQRAEIESAKIAGTDLTPETREAIEKSLDIDLLAAPANICCKIYMGNNKWKHKKMSQKLCDGFAGDKVDDSNCD